MDSGATALIVAMVYPWVYLQDHAHWWKVAWIPFAAPPLRPVDIAANVLLCAPRRWSLAHVSPAATRRGFTGVDVVDGWRSRSAAKPQPLSVCDRRGLQCVRSARRGVSSQVENRATIALVDRRRCTR